MKPGDRVRIHMHDTPDGFRVDLDDLTTRRERLDDRIGRQRVRAHPLHARPRRRARSRRTRSIRSTARPTLAATRGRRTRTTSPSPTRSGTSRTASSSTRTSTARSRASRMPGVSTPTTATTSAYRDPTPRWSRSTDACPATETGTRQSYSNDWPGTDPNVAQRSGAASSPVLFTSPKTNNGTTNYSTIAFEADLPRIEASDSQDNPPFCDTTTGTNCVNPPTGAVLPVLLDHGHE